MLSRDERDAELLIGYLVAVDGDPGRPVTPPASGQGGPLAADNEAAWQIVRRDWRFLALDVTPLEARMMGGTWSRTVRAQWNPRLHPRGAGGEWSAKGGGSGSLAPLMGGMQFQSAQAALMGQPARAPGAKPGVRDRYYVPAPGPEDVQRHLATAHSAGPGFGASYEGRAALTPAEMMAHHDHVHTVPGQNHHHGGGRVV
jgi:hypothetical protein